MSKLQKRANPQHVGSPCPDPGVHQAGAAAQQSLYGSNPSLVSRESIFGPDGKLSSASAAASLKYARPQDLPSFPSHGLYDETQDQSAINLRSNGTSSSAGRAATLAADKGGKLNLWQYQGSEAGHSAANLAIERKKTIQPIVTPNEDGRKKALMAATAVLARGNTGVKTPNGALSDTMSNAGLEQSRFKHQHGMGPEMFTEHPPIPIELEAQRYQDHIRAAAVVMAKRMYELERNKTSAKEARGSSIGSGTNTYLGLEETARKLANERLKALDPDGIQAYRDHYGVGNNPNPGPKYGRPGMKTRTISASTTKTGEFSDDDEEKARKIRGQTSSLRGQLSAIDEKKKQTDRDNLMAVAAARVKARLAGMDEKVFHDTGKAPPSVQRAWEEEARAKATANSEQRNNITTGKVHIGWGKYMDQSEIDAIASARMQPVLDDISANAQKQRERDEEIRLAEEERKAAAAEERQRLQNEKDVIKLKEFEERQVRENMLAEERAEKRRVQAEQDEEKRRLREEKKNERDRIKLHVYHDRAAEREEKRRIEAEQRAERERIAAEERAERERVRAEQAEAARLKAIEDEKIAAEKAETDRVQAEEDRLAGREVVAEPVTRTLTDDAADDQTIRPNDSGATYLKLAEAAALSRIASGGGEIIGGSSSPGLTTGISTPPTRPAAVTSVSSSSRPAAVTSISSSSRPAAVTSISSSSRPAAVTSESNDDFTEIEKPTDEELNDERDFDESNPRTLTATSSAADSPAKQSRRKSFFSRFKSSSKTKKEDRQIKQAVASAPVSGPGIVGTKGTETVREEPELESSAAPTSTTQHATTSSSAHATELNSALSKETITGHSTTGTSTQHNTMIGSLLDPHTSTPTTGASAADEGLYEAEPAGELTPRASRALNHYAGAEDGRISPLEDDDDDVARGRSVISETDDEAFEDSRTNQDTASELSVPHGGYARGDHSPARSASKFQEEL